MVNVCAIICGSRSIGSTEDQVEEGLESITDLCIQKEIKIDEVVSGNARGADKVGEIWAKDNGVNLVMMPANWRGDGKSAGYKRNVRMIHYISSVKSLTPVVIALWDGKSKGTKHTIDSAKALGIKVYIIKL